MWERLVLAFECFFAKLGNDQGQNETPQTLILKRPMSPYCYYVCVH